MTAVQTDEDLAFTILEAMDPFREPLTSYEISVLIEVEKTKVRKVLKEMCRAGQLFDRIEKPDERLVRFGGTARANPARLFYQSSNIPRRVTRHLVPGYIAEPAAIVSLGSVEVRARLARFFKKNLCEDSFQARDVHEATQIPMGTVHQNLKKLEEAGYIRRVSAASRYVRFRQAKKTALLAHLGYATPQPALPIPVPEPPAPTETNSVTLSRAVYDGLVGELKRLKTDNTALRARVVALENTSIPRTTNVDSEASALLSSL